MDESNWVLNFEVDMLHTVRVCEVLIPHLEKSGSGSVAIIGSSGAVETFGAPMLYNVIKAGLITYAEQLSPFVEKNPSGWTSYRPGFEANPVPVHGDSGGNCTRDRLSVTPGGGSRHRREYHGRQRHYPVRAAKSPVTPLRRRHLAARAIAIM